MASVNPNEVYSLDGELLPRLKHVEHFKYYYDLGSRRTHQKAADGLGVSVKSISRWAVAECWSDYVDVWNKEYIDTVKQEMTMSVIKASEEYLAIIKKSIKVYEETLEKGEVVIKNVSDLDKLIRLNYEVLGNLFGEVELTDDNIPNSNDSGVNINIEFVGVAGDVADDKEEEVNE